MLEVIDFRDPDTCKLEVPILSPVVMAPKPVEGCSLGFKVIAGNPLLVD